jgi:(1->4)-alpha-D-glucan 1-alpha-D-glucosylmutase
VGIRVPISTYRLQLTPQFGFSEARAQVPYLSALGISDIYLSPIFKSQKGSLSGYDVVDFTRFNPELGTEAEFDLLVLEIQKHGMGILLDIVPNHMAITSENPFWMDVLENGLSSPYAAFFDVDWIPCDKHIENQILLPVLGKPYGQALEEGEITLNLEDSRIFVSCYSSILPVSLKSYGIIFSYRFESLEADLGVEHSEVEGLKSLIAAIEISARPQFSPHLVEYEAIRGQIRDLLGSDRIEHFVRENIALINGKKGDIRSFDILDDILKQQVYRLAYWRTGREELNYRRFFDIDNLIGIKVESPGVLEATHSLVFRLFQESKIDGLRIDHVDGLYDPLDYLTRLRETAGDFYVVVEKILTGEENLWSDWPVNGTTGYDFAREVNNLFVDNEGLDKIDEHYTRMIGGKREFIDLVYEKKKQVIMELFSSDLRSLGCELLQLAGADRYARDLAEKDLTQVVTEVTANLPVYRTYTRAMEVSTTDRRYLEVAFQETQRQGARLEETALEFLRRVLLLDFSVDVPPAQKLKWLNWVMKWQQFTGPVTAKGLEDTALYDYNPLTSLNMIGAPLRLPEFSVNKFHNFNINRQKFWPSTLNATSTHDSKRSEDVNAAISVLSDMPKDWTTHLFWWRKNNHKNKQLLKGIEVPDPDMEEIIYQTLLGAYPLNDQELGEFRERFKQYILKAAREAKTFTSWINPDGDYETVILGFVDTILKSSESNEFLADFIPFHKQVAFFGALNSLSQVLLKITSPGVPDFYQGNELWKYEMVDPDNRRAVNFPYRNELLSNLVEREKQDRVGLIPDILKNWQDGRVKLYLTYKTLHFRRKNPDLFRKGEYLPVYADGKKRDYVVAFIRHLENSWAIVVVPRLNPRLVEPWDFPLDRHVWGKDLLVMPDNAPSSWTNVFTGETVSHEEGSHLKLAEILNTFPVALLTSPG